MVEPRMNTGEEGRIRTFNILKITVLNFRVQVRISCPILIGGLQSCLSWEEFHLVSGSALNPISSKWMTCSRVFQILQTCLPNILLKTRFKFCRTCVRLLQIHLNLLRPFRTCFRIYLDLFKTLLNCSIHA